MNIDKFKEDFKKLSLDSFDFEERNEQMEFLSSWDRCIKNNEVIFINAPTGIGKTFAYLYPVLKELENSYENNSPEPFKAIISTSTINLQEQIYFKDIPILKKIFDNFIVSILKGRNNYLCRRKVLAFSKELVDLSIAPTLLEWMSNTKTGQWQEIENKIPIFFWRKIESSGSTCLGKNCPHYKNCFYFKARYKAEMSDILIVNHHLLLRDLSKTENRFIDRANSIVIDEAHNFISSVESMATESIASLETEYHIKTISDLFSNENFLIFFKSKTKYLNLIENARDNLSLFKKENKTFWKNFSDLFDNNSSINMNSDELSLKLKDDILELLKEYNEAIDSIKQIITSLELELDDYAEKLSSNSGVSFKGYSINIGVFSEFLNMAQFVLSDCFVDKINDFKIVKWIDIKDKNIVLNALNLNTSYELSKSFIQDEKSYLFTSASLSLGSNFNHMKKPLGISKARELFLDSPFNLKEQIDFYLSDFQYVYNDKNYYKNLDKILSNILVDGHALVLFSSYKDMNLSFKNFKKNFKNKKINLYIQGRDFSRTELIDMFKKKNNSILFATRSFWEGIDIKGKKLSTLVIVKLPFKSMNDPIIYNKNKILQQYGRNPFFELMLPDMMLTLKQGIGRLIRSKSDEGKVYILDSRFKNSKYSNIILNEFKEYKFSDFNTNVILKKNKTLFD